MVAHLELDGFEARFWIISCLPTTRPESSDPLQTLAKGGDGTGSGLKANTLWRCVTGRFSSQFAIRDTWAKPSLRL